MGFITCGPAKVTVNGEPLEIRGGEIMVRDEHGDAYEGTCPKCARMPLVPGDPAVCEHGIAVRRA